MSFLTGSTRHRLKSQETKMKRAKHQRDDVSDECPCCGEHSITVREVLEAQSHDNVMALWASMRHRPHYTADGRIAIVDVVEGKEVCVWSKDDASTFLNEELLPGPYGAELVLEFGPERRITFEGGHLVALAAALQTNLVAIQTTS
jgi:hypothetical protein